MSSPITSGRFTLDRLLLLQQYLSRCHRVGQRSTGGYPFLLEVRLESRKTVHEFNETTHRLGAWSDLALMTFTFLLTLLWNVEVGIAASLAVSLLLVIHRSSKARLSILVCPNFVVSPKRLAHLALIPLSQGRVPGTDKWKPINEEPTAEEDVPGVLIVRIRENLDFG